ncbi:MAG: GTPase [Paracoccaceae bacterium]
MTQKRTLTRPITKMRVAIMGEFNAGKSSLCNLLLRHRLMPEKVTATQLPPVWMSKGPGHNHIQMIDGRRLTVTEDRLDALSVPDTRHVRLFFDADVLEHCDLIDVPGISDPNMDARVWERVLSDADAVIWLTHATQAWRQTEAAAWDTVPEHVRQRSALLVSRFDKLHNARDQARVLGRVRAETKGLFDRVFPISLTHTMQDLEHDGPLRSSGVAKFVSYFENLIGTDSAQRAASQALQDSLAQQSAVTSDTIATPTHPKQTVKPVSQRRIVSISVEKHARPGLLQR